MIASINVFCVGFLLIIFGLAFGFVIEKAIKFLDNKTPPFAH
jgi:hypothetical protein